MKSLLRSFLLLAIFSAYTSALFAQNSYTISGSVFDESTNESIIGAQVFLNGTTIGTTTRENGDFELSGIPEGIYELVVSFLGYESQSVTFNTQNIEEDYNFVLTPTTYEMDEIVVKPDPKLWEEDFKVFKKNFLGTGPFSEDTKILNPEVLNFYYDDVARIFTAKAYDRLIIENKALGYKIYYLLAYFEVNYAAGSNSYAGQPFFEPMQSRRRRTNNRWTKNRELAYNGSYQHFIQSLIDEQVHENGFIVKAEQHKDGERYLYDRELPLSYYFTEADSSTFELKFDDFLNVTYENELEDISFLYFIRNPFDSNPRMLSQPQNSIMTILQDSVLIDKSGYIHDPLAVMCGGYWSFEKISDLLPLDYTPFEE